MVVVILGLLLFAFAILLVWGLAFGMSAAAIWAINTLAGSVVIPLNVWSILALTVVVMLIRSIVAAARSTVVKS